MMSLYCTQGHENPPFNKFCQECGQPLPIHLGKILHNRYRLERILGQGGFGRTYLAEDITLANEKCVLKEFTPQELPPEQWQKAQELFEREARVLQQLHHSQIPRFRETLKINLGGRDYLFLVQDYIEGETYYQLLADGLRFTEAEIRQLLIQLLPVLSYIHSQNVVHRDISPDNIILRNSDKLPVLIDFGGVKQLEATPGGWGTLLGVLGTRLGKKGYAPDEQLRQGRAFSSSDLYALAVTGLVLLTGKEPQELYDGFKATWRWGKEISVSPQLEAVLKKMLAFKPGSRYQSAAEVLQALQSPIKPNFSNTYISRMRTFVFAPKGNFNYHPSPNPPNNAGFKLSLPSVQIPFWLRRLAIMGAGAGLILFTGISAFGVINTFIHSKAVTTIVKRSSDSTPTSDTLLSRRQALGIPGGFFNTLVNERFYAKHPELQGRSLTTNSQDAQLRDDWQSTAQEFFDKIQQAQLSKEARRRLGSYSIRDYSIWKVKANQHKLGNYTIDQLKKETNAKFYQLFPELPDRKLNQKTFAQIWYAIAANKVSQLEAGN